MFPAILGGNVPSFFGRVWLHRTEVSDLEDKEGDLSPIKGSIPIH